MFKVRVVILCFRCIILDYRKYGTLMTQIGLIKTDSNQRKSVQICVICVLNYYQDLMPH